MPCKAFPTRFVWSWAKRVCTWAPSIRASYGATSEREHSGVGKATKGRRWWIISWKLSWKGVMGVLGPWSTWKDEIFVDWLVIDYLAEREPVKRVVWVFQIAKVTMRNFRKHIVVEIFFVQLATRDLRQRLYTRIMLLLPIMAGIQRNLAKSDESRTNSRKFTRNVEIISVYQRTPVKMGPATHVGEKCTCGTFIQY